MNQLTKHSPNTYSPNTFAARVAQQTIPNNGSPEREPYVEQELQRLDKAVGELRETAACVSSRLISCVRQQDPPQEEKNCAEPCCGVALADRIASLRAAIQDVSRQLISLRDRIEVP